MKNKRKMASQLQIPPEYWKWFVLFGAHFGLLLSVGPAKVLGVFLVRFKEEFNASTGVIGSIATLILLIHSIFGLVSSMLCKRYSCRFVTIIAGVLISIGLILTSFSTSVFQLFLFVDVLTGIGIGLAGNPFLIVITQYFDKNYATANGVAMAGVDLGLVVLPPLADFLSETYGWRGAIFILGAISLNVSAMGALFRPIPRIQGGTTDDAKRVQELDTFDVQEPKVFNSETDLQSSNDCNENGSSTSSHYSRFECDTMVPTVTENKGVEDLDLQQQKDQPVDSKCTSSIAKRFSIHPIVNAMDLKIFKMPRFLVLLPVSLLAAMGNSSILAHIIARGISIGISPFKSSFLLSAIGLVGMVARAIHGIIIDKGWTSAARLYTLSVFLAGALTLLSLLCRSFSTLLVYCLLYGSMYGAFQSAMFPVLRNIIPSRHLPGAVAWLFIFRGVGAVLGGLISGVLYDVTGSYDRSFQVTGACFLLAATLMLTESYGKGRRKRRESLKLIRLSELHEKMAVPI